MNSVVALAHGRFLSVLNLATSPYCEVEGFKNWAHLSTVEVGNECIFGRTDDEVKEIKDVSAPV